MYILYIFINILYLIDIKIDIKKKIYANTRIKAERKADVRSFFILFGSILFLVKDWAEFFNCT